MLRVTIELLPGGDEDRAKVIAHGSIGNVSDDLTSLCDYVCKFEENPWQGRVRGPYSATLAGWPRTERGAWDIVHAALGEALQGKTGRGGS
jgi:hypothetical protein